MPTAHRNALAAITASVLFWAALPALAQTDIELTLQMAGEAYEGGPSFSVFFDDKEIGSGTLQNAIDTATEGRLRDAPDYAVHAESFSFPISPDVFTEDGTVQIRFTNDRSGPDGDRNLFVLSATLAGHAVRYEDFVVTRAGEPHNGIPAGLPMVVLYGGSTVASILPPDEGWDVDPSSPAPDPAQALTEIEAAAEPAAPPASCAATGELAVTGFALNSAELSATQRNGLDALLEGADPATCTLVITGYSSLSGPGAWNERLALMRAQAVSAYITGQNADFDAVSVRSGGETDRFGATNAENQRVVVSVGAP